MFTFQYNFERDWYEWATHTTSTSTTTGTNAVEPDATYLLKKLKRTRLYHSC